MSNVVLNPGVGGATAGTDLVASVDYQIVKIGHSAAGAVPVQTSLANPLPTRSTGATSAITKTAANAASVTVLASNANRLRAWLYNDDPAVAVLVKYGAVAAVDDFTKRLLPREFFVVEGYTGIIDAIWEAGPTGKMRATELTA